MSDLSNRRRGRVHYYVHGRGRGHGTRTLKVTEALTASGFTVRIFSGEDPLSMIRESHPAEAVVSLMPGRPTEWPALLRHRIRAGIKAIEQDAPLTVISDGDLPGLIAAKRCGIPSIAVGRAEVFGETVRPPCAPLLPWVRESLSAKISSFTATRHVAVSFVASEPKNRGTLTAAPAVETIVRRPMPDLDAVCYFRDENGGDILRCLSDANLEFALFSRAPDAAFPQNISLRTFPLERSAFLDALGRTRAVIASAGSQLTSECAAAGIPLFALHAANDDEQRINVALIKTAGIGDGTSFEAFEPTRLRKFLAAHRSGSTPVRRIPAPTQRVDEAVCGLVEALAARSLP